MSLAFKPAKQSSAVFFARLAVINEVSLPTGQNNESRK
jgi:hypothetical protein